MGGAEEWKAAKLTVKNMQSGQQDAVDIDSLVTYIKEQSIG